MENVKRPESLKELHGKYTHPHHLESPMNTLQYLPYDIFVALSPPSVHLAVHASEPVLPSTVLSSPPSNWLSSLALRRLVNVRPGPNGHSSVLLVPNSNRPCCTRVTHLHVSPVHTPCVVDPCPPFTLVYSTHMDPCVQTVHIIMHAHACKDTHTHTHNLHGHSQQTLDVCEGRIQRPSRMLETIPLLESTPGSSRLPTPHFCQGLGLPPQQLPPCHGPPLPLFSIFSLTS